MRTKAAMLLVAGVLGATLGAAPPAGANVTVIMAMPGAAVQGHPAPYGLSYAGTQSGTALTFVNLDALSGHNVTAKNSFGSPDQPWCEQFAPGPCPLFWSETVEVGTATPILGTELLRPAALYAFVCTVHPSWMTGQILAA
ncbi:MAG TPA: hypothetical protein VGB52_08150 [Actinomycetota bacterium]